MTFVKKLGIKVGCKGRVQRLGMKDTKTGREGRQGTKKLAVKAVKAQKN